jgi:hypothetical protein
MRFRTKVLRAGRTATGVEVPAKIVDALGSTKRPLVKVTINGYTYRNAIAPMGGVFMLGISEEVRSRAGVAGGDTIDVDVELDTQPRDVEVPPELAKALARDAKAKKYFETLSYSKKNALVAPIANGKTAETRERNLAKAMDALRTGKG